MSAAAADRIGLACRLLDHQLVDSRGERCGKVDDVLLRRHGDELRVEAILCGPGALAHRARHRPARWFAGLAGDELVLVHWRDVTGLDGHVQLARSAPTLGLSRGEQHAAEVLERVLGTDADAVRLGPDRVARMEPDPKLAASACIRLSDVLGVPAELGGPRVREVFAHKAGPILNEVAGNAWVVTGIASGVRGLGARIGLGGHVEVEPSHMLLARASAPW